MTTTLLVVFMIVSSILGSLINILCNRFNPFYYVVFSIILLLSIGVLTLYISKNLLIIFSFYGGYIGSLVTTFFRRR